MPTLAWHYTISDRWEAIKASGAILPTKVLIERNERPAVWFTTRESYEPTACKSLQRPDGSVRELSVQDMLDMGITLYRIGVDRDELLSFLDWRRRSGCSRRMVRALIRVAHQAGSNPDTWYASFEPVHRDRWRTVELWDGKAWTPSETT